VYLYSAVGEKAHLEMNKSQSVKAFNLVHLLTLTFGFFLFFFGASPAKYCRKSNIG